MAVTSCVACASGSKHAVDLKGEVKTVHDLNTYVAKPPGDAAPTKAIVIIPDAYGWEFSNNRSLADKLAAEGFLVYLPDFMNGYSLETEMLPATDTLNSPTATYFQKARAILSVMYYGVPFMLSRRPGVCRPVVEKFFTALREDEGKSMKIGVAAYCWGAGHALSVSSKTTEREPLVDACYMAHPSMTSRKDFESVTQPLSIAVGSLDSAYKEPAQRETKTLFESEKKDIPFEQVVYDGAFHGFAIRYDMHHDTDVKQADQARDQLLNWFNKYF